MPVYNSHENLKESVNSVLSQSFEDFELICVDDGSSDDSLDILNEFSSNDRRIKIISQSNQGSGSSRNRGIEACSGEYICFIDSDDYMVEDCLKKVYENIVNNDSDIAFYKIGNIVNNERVKIRPYFNFDKMFPNADFNNFTFNYKQVPLYVLNYHFAPWTKMYKKEFLDKYDDFRFDETLPYEDMMFHVKCILRASKISFVPEYLYYYRIDNLNSVSFYNEDHIKIFEVLDMVGDFLKRENHFDELKEEYDFYQISHVIRHITSPVDENYYSVAKDYLDRKKCTENTIISDKLKKRYNVFFDSDTGEIYDKNIKIVFLQEKYDGLKRNNEKLKNENVNLKKELDKQKELNEKLISSKSWKMTKYLRNTSDKFK